MKKEITKFFAVILIINAILYLPALALNKPKDKAGFVQYTNEFWDEIKKSTDEFRTKKDSAKKTFKMDYSGKETPPSVSEFKQYFHNTPLSQGATGTCWCFSGTSFLESEIYRINKKEIKISEIFTVYWEYVEKARRFVSEHGNSAFSEGSQCNAVLRIWKQYGCVQASEYSGMLPGQKFHDHGKMFEEMNQYLLNIKQTHVWNEEQVLSNIKSIMNFYLGKPPEKVIIDGKAMTPNEYLHDVVRLNPDDYVDFMSLIEKPYWQPAEYEVTDNWWKFSNYYNVPLDDFMNTVKKAVKAGYTLAIGGDVSESGYDKTTKACMIPDYDIPSEYINEYARQLRFTNQSTTDDHGIHIVGYKETPSGFWFLIKDSGSSAQTGVNKGYYFYHEDYIKLKIMNFSVHKDAVKDLLIKFIK
ncbi:MAG: Aminopeptidase [Ignavibacteria bacterium]|nr:Aminopeptidase [Ignavibacteria bacterium]